MLRYLLYAFVCAFSACHSPAFAAQPLKLNSGKSIEILAVGPLQSTHGWSALTLKYRTLVPLTDIPALRKEVDEIWERFVIDAERGGYENALISANEPEQGIIVTANKSYNFAFEKKDGTWRTFEQKSQTKLDPDFVKEFVERIDWEFENNNLNALLLYMSNDWTVTIVNPEGNNGSQTVDRLKFIAATRATFSAAKNRYHRREILNVAIGSDGLSAKVESREVQKLTVNERTISGTERSTDIFELRGAIMLWTKSNSTIESKTETPE